MLDPYLGIRTEIHDHQRITTTYALATSIKPLVDKKPKLRRTWLSTPAPASDAPSGSAQSAPAAGNPHGVVIGLVGPRNANNHLRNRALMNLGRNAKINKHGCCHWGKDMHREMASSQGTDFQNHKEWKPARVDKHRQPRELERAAAGQAKLLPSKRRAQLRLVLHVLPAAPCNQTPPIATPTTMDILHGNDGSVVTLRDGPASQTRPRNITKPSQNIVAKKEATALVFHAVASGPTSQPHQSSISSNPHVCVVVTHHVVTSAMAASSRHDNYLCVYRGPPYVQATSRLPLSR